MKKTITCSADQYDLEKIDELKDFYAECWNCKPETISTSDIIKWSIGMLHRIKCEQNYMFMTSDDIKYGRFPKDILNTKNIYALDYDTNVST